MSIPLPHDPPPEEVLAQLSKEIQQHSHALYVLHLKLTEVYEILSKKHKEYERIYNDAHIVVMSIGALEEDDHK